MGLEELRLAEAARRAFKDEEEAEEVEEDATRPMRLDTVFLDLVAPEGRVFAALLDLGAGLDWGEEIVEPTAAPTPAPTPPTS